LIARQTVQTSPIVPLLTVFMLVVTPRPSSAATASYDPLSLSNGSPVSHSDFTVRDDSRKRDIPIRVYLPATTNPAPVALFSHGLGGTRENSPYLGEHWAARGYVGVFLQHPGSDDSVWRDSPMSEWMTAMKKAASGPNLVLRVKDVPAVLNQLEEWNKQAGHPLRGRMDLTRVGMSGHSFGAITTQAVSGQSFGRGGTVFTDARIDAAVAFSPSSPSVGDPASAFGSVKIPWMLMTGTKDNSIIVDTTVESRLNVYPHLAPGGKYELVLYNAEHSAFIDRALPGDREARNPNHHRAILALTTAFWDAYLKSNTAALAWLQGAGPRSVLEDKDRWQWK